MDDQAVQARARRTRVHVAMGRAAARLGVELVADLRPFLKTVLVRDDALRKAFFAETRRQFARYSR